MKYRIRHYTEYSYPDVVNLCYNRLCMTPVSTSDHECLSSDISIVPTPDEITYRTDFFGNHLVFFSVYKEHKKLRINATSVVNIEGRPNEEAASRSTISWNDVLAAKIDLSHEIVQFTLPSQYVPLSALIQEFTSDCFPEETPLWTCCHALMEKIHNTIEFKPGFTTINTPVETLLKLKKGVCQDFAHLMIACLRNLGLPARYVSGYIETIPPPGKERLVGADASHAWVSVYFPDVGWVAFDPTNRKIPSSNHIIVANGRDYLDVAPIKGIVFSSGEQKLMVKVDVERIS